MLGFGTLSIIIPRMTTGAVHTVVAEPWARLSQ